MWYCFQQRRLRCPQNLMWTNCQPRIRSSKPHRSFWDRNTRETVKPPIGLRKSNVYFQLSFSMDSIISFHDLSNETKTFLQSMFNHCSINVLFMKQWCSLLSNVLLAFWLSAFFLASKTAVTLIHPIFSFVFSFLFFLMCVRVWGYQAHFLLCASQDAANEKFVNRRYRMHPGVQARAS